MAYFELALSMLEKRGPEKQSDVKSNNFLIGFQRLGINDLSNGNQPFMSDDKSIIVVCNGEIFNYKNLIEKYNLSTKSSSDCEVILRLYEKNLLKVEEFNGDFAFLILDKNSERIILGRDRIGVKPLFYGYGKDGTLAVSSESKCMSICNTILHVPPASLVKFDTHLKATTTFYYDMTHVDPIFASSHDIKTLLIESTRKRLISDRPIGCLLSGGLDSSIICAILCHLLGPKNVRTYSIGMEGSLDLFYAKKVATFLGTNHTEVLFTPSQGLNVIPEVIYNVESYDITTIRASVGMYLLGQYINKNTDDKVILSGEGSDELFCGYLYFHYAPTTQHAHDESLRLITEMYKYDVLRADRCISCNGLELRVPFLDPDVIEYAKSLDPNLKAPNGRIEKKILRDAFKGMLPDDVLSRTKDGFSDGVSGKSKPWYQHIAEFTEGKEGEWYKSIYDRYFSHYPNPIDYYWMPKWIDCKNNPSGRVLTVFEK